MTSRYFVGIDLGTTNSAVAYFDTAAGGHSKIHMLPIPQVNSLGIEEYYFLLPSFLFLAEQGPHVGMLAKEEGKHLPNRLIHSAKSWLLNPAAARKEKILPLDAAEDVTKMTAVEASSHFLSTIASAWQKKTKTELAEQVIVLTVPASFDEIARNLTVEAAKMVGLKHVILLEEPQSAFYSWLMENAQVLSSHFCTGDTILIVDVGGGTTDFSVIEVNALATGMDFVRKAVGRHLLLGGDNMDLALTHLLIEKHSLQNLDFLQRSSLSHLVRETKEALLSGKQEKAFLWLGGRGARLIGGGMNLELTREEVEKTLVDGFFSIKPYEEARQVLPNTGIRSMGLPYEKDPSITKQLASFLFNAKVEKKPHYLLFNGGALKPSLFQERLCQAIDLWFQQEHKIQILPSNSLDLAVAKGAAYFAKVRAGVGIRIRGGIPRAYYLQVDTQEEKKKALVLVPRGLEEGVQLPSQYQFSTLTNTPIQFQLYLSHTRLDDKIGELIDIEEQFLSSLPPLQTIVRFGKQSQSTSLPVTLQTHLTEMGTLELWLSSLHSEHKWKIEFDVRSQDEVRHVEETFEIPFLETSKKALVEAFQNESPVKIMGNLEKKLEMKREAWPAPLLRLFFDSLAQLSVKRKLSHEHEERFWNLLGFFLRPGFGTPLDEFRIKQMWKLILEDEGKTASNELLRQKCICYRRISGGLSKGQQTQLFNSLVPKIYDKKAKKIVRQGKNQANYSEIVRALAAMELVENDLKISLGQALVNKMSLGEIESCDSWALMRLGARTLLHGTVANVISASICEKWLDELLSLPFSSSHAPLLFFLSQKTEEVHCNLSETHSETVKSYLQRQGVDLSPFETKSLSQDTKQLFYGDSLPIGLSIHNSN